MSARTIKRLATIERYLREVAEWLDDNAMGNGHALSKLDAAHGALILLMRDVRSGDDKD